MSRNQTTDYADFTDLKRNHPQIGQIEQIEERNSLLLESA
jgi:hypothetical protein